MTFADRRDEARRLLKVLRDGGVIGDDGNALGDLLEDLAREDGTLMFMVPGDPGVEVPPDPAWKHTAEMKRGRLVPLSELLAQARAEGREEAIVAAVRVFMRGATGSAADEARSSPRTRA